MDDFKKRLQVEMKELEEKFYKLDDFIDGKIFDTLEREDKNLLIMQLQTMRQYVFILHTRFDRLKG